MKVKYLIIGAGPTAMGAAYRLKELGEEDFLLTEKESWVGGLATSFNDDNGFTWDIGGHVQFSHYKYFDQVMDEALGKDGWFFHERESWVWMRDRFIPYPFQNNIRHLPKDELWQCLSAIIDLFKDTESPKPHNFREWIEGSFGKGIAEVFMLPYNYKVWAYPPEDMAFQWIGERVATIDIKQIVENIIFDKDSVSWGPNNTFHFPKYGGTGAIWKSVAEKIGMDHIHLNTKVASINSSSKEAKLSNGQSIRYDKILSTMPLDCLAQLVDEMPSNLKARAKELPYSSSHIIGIGLSGQPKTELSTKCWMYFPEDNSPFYRVTLFSKYSPFNVPDASKQFSLMAEVSESPKKKVNHDTVVADTIQGLRNTKLIDDSHQIISKWSYLAPYGYPTPGLKRDSILKELIPALEQIGVYSRGRFGAWKYEVSNQDHSFMQGVEWVNFMVDGDAEETFSL